MKTMKKLFGIVLMLMVSMVTDADELVKFDTNKFTGGKVEKASEAVLPQEKEEEEYRSRHYRYRDRYGCRRCRRLLPVHQVPQGQALQEGCLRLRDCRRVLRLRRD